MRPPFDLRPSPAQPQRIRSALFIDFDNVYIGLDQEDSQAARAFADEPAEWLSWMERLMALPGPWYEADTRRSILMRRCYLSPRRFGRYRPSFTRAGFDVVDCPALTMRGKNSADIRMVIDIFDTIQHPTHFDEFIILSSDSDFTPVLSRLRAHDRRTTVLTVGNISGAYRAACDLMIGSEDFIEFGLGRIMLPPGDGPPPSQSRPPEPDEVDEELLRRIAGSIFVEASVNGEIRPEQLASIYIRFPEFTQDSNWLGFFGLRPMTDAVIATRNDLIIDNGDPWTIRIRKPGGPPLPPAPTAAEASDDDLRRRVAEAVEELVRKAKAPVTLARAAQAITAELGDEVTLSRWAGAGTFKDLLQSVSGLSLAFSTVPPGYVYDPGRHAPPRATVASNLDQRHPELSAFVRRVFQITGVPKLSPEQFALVFHFIAVEVNARGYSLSQTSKEVRDHCQAAGESVPRQAVIFVLKGLSYRGYDFESDEPHAPHILAAMFRDNVIDLCENAGTEMTEKQLSLLDRWLLAPIDEAPLDLTDDLP